VFINNLSVAVLRELRLFLKRKADNATKNDKVKQPKCDQETARPIPRALKKGGKLTPLNLSRMHPSAQRAIEGGKGTFREVNEAGSKRHSFQFGPQKRT
jgi:hypothetical protein